MDDRRYRLPTDAGARSLPLAENADVRPVCPQSHSDAAPAAPVTGWVDHQWEARGLVRRFHGTVRLAQIAQSDTEVQANPQFDEIRYLIDDFLDCANLVDMDMSLATELAAIAAVAVRHPEFFRHAVVSSLPSVRELAQEFAQSGFGAYPVRHFDRIDEARRWAMQ